MNRGLTYRCVKVCVQASIRRAWAAGRGLDGYSLMELIIVIIIAGIAIPAIVGMYTTVLTNSHASEMMTIASMLAVEQMEIILADKAGTGGGFGYAAITNGKYSNVNPGPPFAGFSRSVNVQLMNPGQQYEFKLITVTATHAIIPPVVLTAAIMDHSGL